MPLNTKWCHPDRAQHLQMRFLFRPVAPDSERRPLETTSLVISLSEIKKNQTRETIRKVLLYASLFGFGVGLHQFFF
jgi:hypothetical protein